MDNKILDVLLDMQSGMKQMQSSINDMQSGMKQMQSSISDMQKDLKEVKERVNKIEYKMNDGFETLELLCENNSNEISKVKLNISKLENRVKELSVVN